MRLFVAINLPATLRHEIWTASAPLREADLPVRWTDESVLHLTLKFLGQCDPDRLPEIKSVLDQVVEGNRPFALPFGGFGAFPSVERPRVVWVGCEGVPPLELMQHRLEVGMERLGFPVEGRPFRPHLTLGRVQKDARPRAFHGLARMLEGLEYEGACTVGSVELMESRLGRGGARYEAVHSVRLVETS